MCFSWPRKLKKLNDSAAPRRREVPAGAAFRIPWTYGSVWVLPILNLLLGFHGAWALLHGAWGAHFLSNFHYFVSTPLL